MDIKGEGTGYYRWNWVKMNLQEIWTIAGEVVKEKVNSNKKLITTH